MKVDSFKEESGPASEQTLESVSLETLASLTGFPVEFIKSELFIEGQSELSLDELRKKALSYLESEF